MITELSIKLKQRRAELESNVFNYPASSWEDYQRRLGQWIELTTSIEQIDDLIKGKEKDL